MNSDKMGVKMNRQDSSFFKYCFSKQKFLLISCLAIDIAIFSLSLIFLYLLFQISFQKNSENVMIYITILSLLITSKYILSSFRLYFDVKLRRILISNIQNQFSKSAWKHDSAASIARLINRDIGVLLEFISNSLKFFYFPIAIALMLVPIYILEGIHGVFALSTVSIFILLSWYIARKSIYLANNIYTISKIRIDKSSWFLSVRAYLKNWNELESLSEIKNVTTQEISLRNKDSFIRSLDLYIILFGSVLPVLILLIIATTSGQDINHYLLIVLWFAKPMISLVMEMGRFGSDYTVAKRAFEEIKLNLNINTTSLNMETIELNETWEIWSGSISDNVLSALSPSNLSLSAELGLDDELKNRQTRELNVNLDFLGTNLSQGQKTRVLLIRAIHLSIATKKILNINISLHSLDPISCRKLYNALPEIQKYCQINFTKDQHDFFQDQIVRSSTYENFHRSDQTSNYLHATNNAMPKNEVTIHQENFFYYYKKLAAVIGVFFTIPAIFLSLNGYIISSDYSANKKIYLLILITILSLIIAPTLGYLIERKNRKKATFSQDKLLRHANLDNLNDLMQRLSKDFTVMIERISWYIHDIAWYKALILISFSAIIYTAGIGGVLINILFLSTIVLICKIFSSAISQARTGAVEGINFAIDTLQNLAAIGNVDHSTFTSKRNILSSIGFEKLINTHIKMVLTKINFSNLISVSTGIFIIIVVTAASLTKSPKNEIVFLLTSLLAMEATIVNLFQALTGLNAQLLSYIRLDKLPIQNPDENSNISICKKGDHYLISDCMNSKLNISYKPLILQVGNVFSLSGNSGLGKSEYLKTISGFTHSQIADNSITPDTSKIKVIYFGENSIELLRSLNKPDLLDYVTKKMVDENYKIIIFDETFRMLAPKNTQVIITKLENILIKTQSSLILVDHRFELKNNQISISHVINNQASIV
jgi:ABC-type phosphate transport system ATPase subunit